jgi:hypothetical protein
LIQLRLGDPEFLAQEGERHEVISADPGITEGHYLGYSHLAAANQAVLIDTRGNLAIGEGKEAVFARLAHLTVTVPDHDAQPAKFPRLQ